MEVHTFSGSTSGSRFGMVELVEHLPAYTDE
jgi:hypothetical protein